MVFLFGGVSPHNQEGFVSYEMCPFDRGNLTARPERLAASVSLDQFVFPPAPNNGCLSVRKHIRWCFDSHSYFSFVRAREARCTLPKF